MHAILIAAGCLVVSGIATQGFVFLNLRRMQGIARSMERANERFAAIVTAEGQLQVAGRTGDYQMARVALQDLALLRQQ